MYHLAVVCPVILEAHLVVDQSALSTLIVQIHKLAFNKNVEILVLVLVVLVHYVPYLVTRPYVLAQMDTPGMHSLSVTPNLQVSLYSTSQEILKIYIYFLTLVTFVVYDETDKCNPSPCGANAICRDGTCYCNDEHQGDPYVGCRPECVLSTDCPRNKACIKNKCLDPCLGTCAGNAICDVVNHIPMCSCPQGMTGNAFYNCERIQGNYY